MGRWGRQSWRSSPLLTSTSLHVQSFCTAQDKAEAKKERRKKRNAKIKAGAKSMGATAKKYGPIFVVTYLGVYVSTLGLVFTALDMDLFNAATFGMDPVQAVEKLCGYVENYLGYKEMPQYIRENPRVGTFALG